MVEIFISWYIFLHRGCNPLFYYTMSQNKNLKNPAETLVQLYEYKSDIVERKERKKQNLFQVLLNLTTVISLLRLSCMLLLYIPQDLPAIMTIINNLIVHFSLTATNNINKDNFVQIRRWLYLHCHHPNLIFF